MVDRTPEFKDALVFTGGGTGGHFFPAVALAEGAQARWSDRSIVFLGAQRGIEARLLPASHWSHLLLEVEGLVGRNPWRTVRSLWMLRRAVGKVKALWGTRRPAAVVGTGGYAAAPGLLAARSLGVPIFLHESNAAPGALVRHVSTRAVRVWCGMSAVRERLPGADCRVVGTPVRAGFLRSFTPAAAMRANPTLLVMGGSGGAKVINEAVRELASGWLEAFPEWRLLHQAGPQEFERLRDQARHERHELRPFIDRVDEAMEQATLVLGRSGASTCAELKAAGRPAVLVPLPTSAGDHQRENALAMAREGRARVVEQGDGFRGRLDTLVREAMAAGPAWLPVAPEANHAVSLCLDDLADYLGWRGSATQATPTEMK